MPISSEFVVFIRETGVKAFDRLSLRGKELDTPLRNFVRSWSRLTDAEKNDVFDQLIATIRTPDEAVTSPAPLKQKKPVKRYDPEEVAATLPKRTVARRSTKSGAKKKSKATSKGKSKSKKSE